MSKRLVSRSHGLRSRAWWLMRELGRWTLPDLLTTLSNGSEGDAGANLTQWLRALEAAGIVARLPRRAVSEQFPRGLTIWRLSKDLGRAAPVWRRAEGVVYDPNQCAVLALTPSPEGRGRLSALTPSPSPEGRGEQMAAAPSAQRGGCHE